MLAIVEPAGLGRSVDEIEACNDRQQQVGDGDDKKHVAPGRHVEGVADPQQPAAQRPAQHHRQRYGDQRASQCPSTQGRRRPLRDQPGHPRCETGLCHAQQEACAVESGGALDMCHPYARCGPQQHGKRQPGLDPPGPEQAHMGILEQQVGEEEHADALAELFL